MFVRDVFVRDAFVRDVFVREVLFATRSFATRSIMTNRNIAAVWTTLRITNQRPGLKKPSQDSPLWFVSNARPGLKPGATQNEVRTSCGLGIVHQI